MSIAVAAWPRFDAVVAINQTVSAGYTLAGVFLGGFVAFRLGLRQLRNARAIDRRLDWSERLHDALAEYKSVLSELVAVYEQPLAKRNADRITLVLGRAQEQTRTVAALLSRAELYGTREERLLAEALSMKAIHVSASLWGFIIDDESEAKSLATVKELLTELEPERRELVSRVRKELGIWTQFDSVKDS